MNGRLPSRIAAAASNSELSTLVVSRDKHTQVHPLKLQPPTAEGLPSSATYPVMRTHPKQQYLLQLHMAESAPQTPTSRPLVVKSMILLHNRSKIHQSAKPSPLVTGFLEAPYVNAASEMPAFPINSVEGTCLVLRPPQRGLSSRPKPSAKLSMQCVPHIMHLIDIILPRHVHTIGIRVRRSVAHGGSDMGNGCCPPLTQ
ncbi:hypothetical protein BDW60DRAFT_11701 [Aspergillus nidulans var. acristatus]